MTVRKTIESHGELPNPREDRAERRSASSPAVGYRQRQRHLTIVLLAEIEPNARDRAQFPNRLAHGRLPFRWGFDNNHLDTLMPFRAPSTPSFQDLLAELGKDAQIRFS
jgi:hypothetical protein